MLDRKTKKVLKKLIAIHNKTGNVTISYDEHKKDLLKVYKKSKKSFENLVYSLDTLKSDRLIEMLRADTHSGAVIVDITLTKGLNYFKSNRREEIRFWLPIIISVLSLVVSIIVAIFK